MKWIDCTLIGKTASGEDALGNPIYALSDIRTCKARFTPWTNDEIQLEGRDVTRNERKLLLRLPFSMFPECMRVRLPDGNYEITQKINLEPRFVLLHVKKYKR